MASCLSLTSNVIPSDHRPTALQGLGDTGRGMLRFAKDLSGLPALRTLESFVNDHYVLTCSDEGRVYPLLPATDWWLIHGGISVPLATISISFMFLPLGSIVIHLIS
jgi:hypothetical protein